MNDTAQKENMTKAAAAALHSLNGFLSALQRGSPDEAFEYFSTEQRMDTPVTEFVEGYRAGLIRLVNFNLEGAEEADPDAEGLGKIQQSVLIPKGTLHLEVTAEDYGLHAPGARIRKEVPLSWILLIRENGVWRIQSKGWGPLHTVRFFGRPKTIIDKTPNAPPVQFMRYEDDHRKYRIALIENWEDFSGIPSLKTPAARLGTKVIGFIKRTGSAPMPNITIQTYDISNRPSVQTAMDYVELARNSGQGKELSSPAGFSHNGPTGVRWEYELVHGRRGRSVTDYYLHGRTLIMVSAVGDPGQFESDRKELISILDSFRFEEKKL
ncbi:MAG: hypothetical protein JXA73_05260 [Acidobacteria bacterium]|nr:hypothetical protein [Acidobacteriota bacterium]